MTIGDPNDLVCINRRHGDILANWKSLPSLGILNLGTSGTRLGRPMRGSVWDSNFLSSSSETFMVKQPNATIDQ